MKKRKGQAVVEFALVFPFFLLIVIGGIIDFGFAFYNHLTLQQIANNTAKYAAYNKADTNQITQYANSLKPQWWDGKFSILSSEPQALKTGGTIYHVSLAYGSPVYTPFYKTMYKVSSGDTFINLSVSAGYKTPEYIASDKETAYK